MKTWLDREHRWKLIGALALIAAAGYWSFEYLAGPPVEVALVTRRDVAQTVVASGRVATPYRVDVGSQVVGTVEKVPVEQGQSVKAGETTVVLESSEARALLAQAEASLANARAPLAHAKARSRRSTA